MVGGEGTGTAAHPLVTHVLEDEAGLTRRMAKAGAPLDAATQGRQRPPLPNVPKWHSNPELDPSLNLPTQKNMKNRKLQEKKIKLKKKLI